MILRVTQGEEILNDYELGEGEYVIGSGDSAQLKIESSLIAPEHARLRIGTGGVEVEDLGSGRETWIGELALVGVQPLPKGSILQLGDIAFQILDGEPAAPVQTDRYLVGAPVAAGAMGVIHSAREVHTGREVAMKQMRPGITDAVLTGRFVQEAKITAHLEHPNVVPVHDVNSGFYTMKMVRGVSLEKLLQLIALGTDATLKKYPLDVLITIFQKVCDAVAFAHSKGVIHRDLKPANIMVGAYGEVLVMDWGLAKLTGHAAEAIPAARPDAPAHAAGGATLDGSIMGTPHYMAPEQASGDNAFVDERSDLYALGAILYEMLVLHPPIDGRNAGEVLQRVRAGKITPPAQRIGAKPPAHLPGGRIPASLAAVAMKALSFSPERRYQQVTDLQAEIAAWQGGFATAAEGAGAIRQLTLFIQRNRAIAGAVAAGLLLLAAATALYTRSVIQERNRTEDARAKAEVQRQRADAALVRLHETQPLLLAKARAYLADGKPEDGIKYLGFTLDVAPENTDLRLERADLLVANNRPAEAIPEYEQVLAERPGDEAAKAGLAKAKGMFATMGPGQASGTVAESDFTYTITDNAVTITKYTGKNELVTMTIPEKIAGLPVREIGKYAFNAGGTPSLRKLTSVTIPSGVTTIGYGAFQWCGGLTHVTIPEGVTTIASHAFNNTALTSLAIPASVTSIGDWAFTGLKNSITVAPGNASYRSVDGVLFNASQTHLLQYPATKAARSYTIPDGVTHIEANAFYGCTALTSVTIPASVISIGPSAFSGCKSLTTATIPAGITSIEGSTFGGCESLTSVTIPPGVTRIGSYAFSACTSLKQVTFPDSVTAIEFRAFNGCKALTRISIPNNVTAAYGAFTECTSLLEIEVPAGNSKYSSVDGVLFEANRTRLVQYPAGKEARSYTIPSSVTRIRHSSFIGCVRLATVDIPESVTAIEAYAFKGCTGLTEVIIPKNVGVIEDEVFSSCTALTRATFKGNAPGEFVKDAFKGVAAGFTIHFRRGASGFTSPKWNDYPATEGDGPK